MSEQLGAEVSAIFSKLLARTETTDVLDLRNEVREHLTSFEGLAKKNGLLPVDIAQELAAGLEEFLDLYADLSAKHRRLVIAAARYFVSEEDARPDTEGVLGLDDDIEVFNYVAEMIGQADRKIDI